VVASCLVLLVGNPGQIRCFYTVDIYIAPVCIYIYIPQHLGSQINIAISTHEMSSKQVVRTDIANKEPIRSQKESATDTGQTSYTVPSFRIGGLGNLVREKFGRLVHIPLDVDTLKETADSKLEIFKMYWRSTIFVLGVLYTFNAFFLYFGSIFEKDIAKPHKFFGFKEGKHLHLQRSNGVLYFFVALINFFAAFKDEVLILSLIGNTVFTIHYLLEILYFVDMRMEVALVQAFICILNLYWTHMDYIHRRKVHALKGEDPNLAAIENPIGILGSRKADVQKRQKKKKVVKNVSNA
jgi:hypothetical protein